MSSHKVPGSARPQPSPREIPRHSFVAVVLDLDGVIYRGKTPIKGAGQTVSALRQRGLKVFFLTNNSTLTRSDYVKRLAGFGIPSTQEEIYSSAYATALYLEKNRTDGGRALVVGEGGLSAELRKVGMTVTRKLDDAKVDYVVVGMDRKITYAKLADAQRAIFAGAKFIATNRDPVYPVEHGLIPGGGSIVAAIETASLRKPLVVGKPSPFILKALMQKEGFKPRQVLLVGDRLDTDIACGRKAKVRTVAVLTGVTERDEISSAPRHLQPDWTIDSIADLPRLIQALEAK